MQDLNIQDFVGDTINKIRDRIDNLNTLNIIVAGKTGVGKSTLINAMFRENLAETGVGKPVTKHMRKLEKEGFPLAIYDTRGFELNKNTQDEVLNLINKTIRAGVKTSDVNDNIHCLWYCINTTSSRVEETEIEWLRAFSESNKSTDVPVVVVLTQAISKEKAESMRQFIMEQNLNVVQVVPVLAMDYKIDEGYTVEAYGLETLLKVMSEILPEELQDSLQNAQKVSLREKVKTARKVVASSAASATGVALTPIPVADATLLVPIQIGMIASITAVFGIQVNKGMLLTFASALLGSGGATMLGRTISGSLIKLIPGLGSVGGSVISAGTAWTVTSALGETYIALMSAIYKGEYSQEDLSGKDGRKLITEMFNKQVKISATKVEEIDELAEKLSDAGVESSSDAGTESSQGDENLLLESLENQETETIEPEDTLLSKHEYYEEEYSEPKNTQNVEAEGGFGQNQENQVYPYQTPYGTTPLHHPDQIRPKKKAWWKFWDRDNKKKDEK